MITPRAKAKLVLGQKPGDATVLNREDARVWAWKEAAVSDVFAFSGKRPVRRGAFVRDGWVVVRDGGEERRILPVSEIKLPGLHNRENVLAAAAAARLLGIAPSRIRASVRGFRGLEHRLEPVATVGGVSFINDSKATTVDATLKALAGFTRPVVLILGGKDKGSDFRPLRKAVRRGVKAVVLVGSAREKSGKPSPGSFPCSRPRHTRKSSGRPGPRPLPATSSCSPPACTSWDMFRDFEERGRVFKREVRRLARRKG